MKNLTFYVKAIWDAEAGVYYSESDIVGLHIEAETLDEFEKAIAEFGPQLIVENHMTKRDLAQEENVPEAERSTWVPTAEQIAQYEKILKGEVEVYDTYIRGEVLGYQVYSKKDDPDLEGYDLTENDDDYWCDEDENSCWGFYGKDAAMEAAKEYIDGL